MSAPFIPKITWTDLDGLNTLEFPDPPVGDPLNEVRTADVAEFKAASGKIAAQRKNVTATYKAQFQWLPASFKANLEHFFDAWGSYKRTFRYYPDKDVDSYFDVVLLDAKLPWGRPLPDGAGDFVYDLTLTLYRVVA